MACNDQDKQREIAYWQEVVDNLKQRYKEAAGLQSVSADGLSVTYGTGQRSSIRAELRYAQKMLQQLQGSAYYKSFDLSGGL